MMASRPRPAVRARLAQQRQSDEQPLLSAEASTSQDDLEDQLGDCSDAISSAATGNGGPRTLSSQAPNGLEAARMADAARAPPVAFGALQDNIATVATGAPSSTHAHHIPRMQHDFSALRSVPADTPVAVAVPLSADQACSAGMYPSLPSASSTTATSMPTAHAFVPSAPPMSVGQAGAAPVYHVSDGVAMKAAGGEAAAPVGVTQPPRPRSPGPAALAAMEPPEPLYSTTGTGEYKSMYDEQGGYKSVYDEQGGYKSVYDDSSGTGYRCAEYKSVYDD